MNQNIYAARGLGAAQVGVPGVPFVARRVGAWIDEIRQLDSGQVQGVTVALQATLGSATTSGTSTYKIPSNYNLAILQMHAYLRFTALNTEDQTVIGYLNLDPTERWLVKAQNCLVTLDNKDRKLKYIENFAVPLAAFMPPMGYPFVLPPEAPGIVQEDETLEATFALQDTTTDIVGNNTVYGLLLSGALVPLKRSR